MAKYHRRKPKNNKKHMKVSRRSYIPKRLRYVDEYHTKMYMNSNGDQGFSLATPTWGNFASSSITFKLVDLLNISAYQKLFEEVRLNKVHIMFRPSTTQQITLDNVASGPPAQVSDAVPMAYYLIDRNDNQLELNADDFKEYSKTVSKVCTKSHSILFTPSTLQPVYGGEDTQGNPIFTYSVDYEKKWMQLNDIATLNTPYFGVKFGIEGSNKQVYTITPTVCLYLSFRGKRE